MLPSRPLISRTWSSSSVSSCVPGRRVGFQGDRGEGFGRCPPGRSSGAPGRPASCPPVCRGAGGKVSGGLRISFAHTCTAGIQPAGAQKLSCLGGGFPGHTCEAGMQPAGAQQSKLPAQGVQEQRCDAGTFVLERPLKSSWRGRGVYRGLDKGQLGQTHATA